VVMGDRLPNPDMQSTLSLRRGNVYRTDAVFGLPQRSALLTLPARSAACSPRALRHRVHYRYHLVTVQMTTQEQLQPGGRGALIQSAWVDWPSTPGYDWSNSYWRVEMSAPVYRFQ
jgi:hypothetical protein